MLVAAASLSLSVHIERPARAGADDALLEGDAEPAARVASTCLRRSSGARSSSSTGTSSGTGAVEAGAGPGELDAVVGDAADLRGLWPGRRAGAAAGRGVAPGRDHSALTEGPQSG